MSNFEFASEFNQAERALMAFAWRLTQNENDALDLFQETAYRAFKSRHSFIPNTNLLAWLTTIMRNTFINDYRKTKRRQILNDETNDHFYLNSGNQKAGNDGESRVLIEELTTIIHQLDEIIRIPFLMHLEGYKYDEIADTLDLPLGTVKSRIFLARKRLQASIRAQYQAENTYELLESVEHLN